MARSKDYPKVIKNGSSVVKVYEAKHATSASGFVYLVRWSTGGRLWTKSIVDQDQALREARVKAAQLSQGEGEATLLSRRDREELTEARAIAGTVPLLTALEEWKRAREIAGAQIIPAAEAWAARNGGVLDPVTVESVVKAFLKAKNKAGVDTSASYDRQLPALLDAFGDRSIGTLHARELSAWLQSRYAHPVTRNTARKRMVTLWRWARKQGWLPRDIQTEAEQTDSAQEAPLKIGIIDAATFAGLLDHFREKDPSLLGPLAIAGFCGLRRAEVHAQLWEDVNLERAFLRVSAAKKNTPAKRLVPLSAGAIAWLKLCPRKGGVSEGLAVDQIRKLAIAAKFVLPDNCFRHAFITHRVAETGDIPRTSLEAGNSPNVIRAHYLELVTEEEGKKWASLKPPGE